MPRNRVIIGVVGGNKVDSDSVELAKEIGAAITQAGSILLTGGQIKESRNVKDAAMRGAANAEHEGAIARLIGILPAGDPNRWPESSNRLFLRTGLEPEERDLIIGITPDAVIVLGGKSGTLCELGFALAAGKVVLFANSLGKLREELKDPKIGKELETNFCRAIAKYPNVPIVGLTGMCLMEFVQTALNSCQDEDGNGSDIVNRAIALAMDRGPLGRPRFPGLPGIDKSQTDFEQLLHHMSG
jgi:uncharacterized protein (TIGR00725 family)